MPWQRRRKQNRKMLPPDERTSRRQFLVQVVSAAACTSRLSFPASDAAPSLAGPASQAGKRPPEWMIVIRVYGNILYATRQWGGERGERAIALEPEHIDGWMKDCAEHGVTAVLWRANCAGTLTYPSRYAALAGEPPLPDPNKGMGIAVVKQGWLPQDWTFLADQCKRFNTLQAGVKSAHRHGLKFYLDFSTFDMVGSWCTRVEWPAGGDRAFNPDLWLWSKDQKDRLAGIPCYGDPHVRKLRAAEISEALDYDIDGVLLGFFSHVGAMAGERRCWFGYNPGVVKEYRKRHRTDPLATEVDARRFYALPEAEELHRRTQRVADGAAQQAAGEMLTSEHHSFGQSDTAFTNAWLSCSWRCP